jgi:uncharacterized protein (TIGR00297 family)
MVTKNMKEEITFKFLQMEGKNKFKFLISRLPTLICLAYQILFQNDSYLEFVSSNFWKNFLLTSYLGIYAANCGDTWSSELGILSSNQPFHILSFQRVPYGTNGGVSFFGVAASFVAGLSLGFVSCFVVFLHQKFSSSLFVWILIISTISSVGGSLLDSILGGIFEYSGYCTETKKIVKIQTSTTQHISGMNLLSGDAVNFLSAGITGIFVGLTGTFI